MAGTRPPRTLRPACLVQYAMMRARRDLDVAARRLWRRAAPAVHHEAHLLARRGNAPAPRAFLCAILPTVRRASSSRESFSSPSREASLERKQLRKIERKRTAIRFFS